MEKAKLTSFNTERLALRQMTGEEWHLMVDRIAESGEFYDMFACEMTKRQLIKVHGMFENRKTIAYSIFIPDNDEAIGFIEFYIDEESCDCNHIGYCIFEEYRRQGYASEAASALIEKILSGELTGSPVDEIRAWIVWGNNASSAVLRKTGFCSAGYRVYDDGLIRQDFIYAPVGMEETA